MKKLGIFGKFIFILNSIAAVLLLLTFILPYVSPQSFPTLSILSLLVSPLLFANVIFAVYWLIRMRKQFFLSAIIIVLTFFQFNTFFIVGENISEVEYQNKLSVLSYNVHLFNAYSGGDFKQSEVIFNEIINDHKPDVICLQEYNDTHAPKMKDYPYVFEHFKTVTLGDGIVRKKALGHAILSKYPLINNGAFDFKGTTNNTLFVDVLKGKDTIRLYNLHLKSIGISPNVSELQKEDKEMLIGRISKAFKEQASQVADILNDKHKSQYPVIIAGDFNNTAFSYIYNQLIEGMNDAYSENGTGLGATFDFDGYPLRIDYILAQENFNVLSFKTIEKTFSDHHPIIATFGWD